MAAKKFVIRNYGQTRRIAGVLIVRDKAIETHDEELATSMGSHDNIHVTEQIGEPQITGRAIAVAKETSDKEDDKPEEPVADEESPDEEISYDEFKVPELKELLKDRELPVKGSKAEMIQALELYDSKEEKSEEESDN